MVKVLFVCHGSIKTQMGFPSSRNDFSVLYPSIYTTFTPFAFLGSELTVHFTVKYRICACTSFKMQAQIQHFAKK